MKRASLLPHARGERLVVRELLEETLVYDLERHKAHCLSRALAAIWRQCDGKSTADRIAARVGRELDSPIDEETVWVAVHRLARARLLRAPLPIPPGARLASRREWLRKAATIGGLSVLSVTAPSAVQAITCIPNAECAARRQSAGCTGRHCCSNWNLFCVKPGGGAFCSCQ